MRVITGSARGRRLKTPENYDIRPTTDNVKVAGRIIIACSNKTLYILHVSCPQGYTKTYVDNVYDKFRHTVKSISQ